MKKKLLSWGIPFVFAIIIVIVAKMWLFSTYEISNNSMAPNIIKGDKVLCINKKARKRNKLVLFANDFEYGTISLKRQIAIPGDTLAVKAGIFVVNGNKIPDIEGVIQRFSFQSDSISSISKYLNDNNIVVDIKKAYLGYFDCQLDAKKVNELKSNSSVSSITKRSLEQKIQLNENNFGSEFYWNHDNLGSLIVPKKGMQIKLGRRAFHLYKDIIETESEEQVIIRGTNVFIGKVKTSIYSFKDNYYFLVNDNRSNNHDSRTYGFIPENKIIGTFVFELPW